MLYLLLRIHVRRVVVRGHDVGVGIRIGISTHVCSVSIATWSIGIGMLGGYKTRIGCNRFGIVLISLRIVPGREVGRIGNVVGLRTRTRICIRICIRIIRTRTRVLCIRIFDRGSASGPTGRG